ncbi:dermonecrotic toxin domain-containing protein [Pseudomonas brassicae]|uniref:dermonecrotic toxin domain-containing protein n=1 Tax=Pseudomonas brassicae TaxID=2708063 RepID=UPI001FB20A16|nr:DUF6543 domain-containing protein [Pseudomonas brassicae]
MTSRFISTDGVQHIRNSLENYPRPDQAAANAVRQWASLQGIDLDPDKVDAVTLHYQFKGQHPIAKVTQRMTLTQALLANWQGESSNDLVAPPCTSHGPARPHPTR